MILAAKNAENAESMKRLFVVFAFYAAELPF